MIPPAANCIIGIIGDGQSLRPAVRLTIVGIWVEAIIIGTVHVGLESKSRNGKASES